MSAKPAVKDGLPSANSFEDFHVNYAPEKMPPQERERLLRLNIDDELSEIANDLEDFHGVFYQLFDMGTPSLTFRVPTAAVAFNQEGHNTDFMFNPVAWERLNAYTKAFIICHECLHVMLNHGIRSKDCPIPQLANIALDIVVNHMLVSKFGFNRASIDMSPLCEPGEPTTNDRGDDTVLCWIDTVFKEHASQVMANKPFEYYYHLLEQNVVIQESGGMKLRGKFGKGKGKGSGSGGKGGEDQGDEQGDGLGSDVGGRVLDDHSGLEDFSNGDVKKEISDALNERLSDEEKEDVNKRINKTEEGNAANKKGQDKDKGEGGDVGGREAGSIAGNIVFHPESRRVKKKRKWETIIKKWSRRYLSDESSVEQWARQNRRLMALDLDLMVPSEHTDEHKDVERIDVVFYQDFSGSCFHLAERFFKAAKSLPTDRFNVKTFCFDTEVNPVDLDGGDLRGGGGTSFRILEKHVQKLLKQGELKRYPDAVFVITDGMGDDVHPQDPTKWYWFLSDGWSTEDHIPEGSHIYKLSQFE
tara:strand:- start:479318 stop:480904 length:1587 start_codon:yes stop_codon:yes gene_type:complete